MSWVFGDSKGSGQPIRTYGKGGPTRPMPMLGGFRSQREKGNVVSPGLDEGVLSPKPVKRSGALSNLDANRSNPHGDDASPDGFLARRNNPKRKKSAEPVGLEVQLKKLHKTATPEVSNTTNAASKTRAISTSPVSASVARPSRLSSGSTGSNSGLSLGFAPDMAPPTKTSRQPRKQGLRELLSTAHPDDMALLRKSIFSRNGRSGAGFGRFEGVVVAQPNTTSSWSRADTTRLNAWLESLGFAQDWLGERPVHVLPTENVSDLQRGLSQATSGGDGRAALRSSAEGRESIAGGMVAHTPGPEGISFTGTFPPSGHKTRAGMIPMSAATSRLTLNTRFPPRAVADSDPYADSPSTASEPPTPLGGMDSPFFNDAGAAMRSSNEDYEIRAGLNSLALANRSRSGSGCGNSGVGGSGPGSLSVASDGDRGGSPLEGKDVQVEDPGRLSDVSEDHTHDEVRDSFDPSSLGPMRRGGSRESLGRARTLSECSSLLNQDCDVGDISDLSGLLQADERGRDSSSRPRLSSASSIDSNSSMVRNMVEMTIPQSPVATIRDRDSTHSVAATPHSGTGLASARFSSSFPTVLHDRDWESGGGSGSGSRRAPRALRRSISESGVHVHMPTNAEAGHITPGGIGRSGTEFCTPQGQRVRISGKGDRDWGVSKGCHVSMLRAWQQAFLSLAPGDLGPPVSLSTSTGGGTRLRRSNTTGGILNPQQKWGAATKGLGPKSVSAPGGGPPLPLPNMSELLEQANPPRLMPMRLGLPIAHTSSDDSTASEYVRRRSMSPIGYTIDMPAAPMFRGSTSFNALPGTPSTLADGVATAHATPAAGAFMDEAGFSAAGSERRGSAQSRLSADAAPWCPQDESSTSASASASVPAPVSTAMVTSPLRPSGGARQARGNINSLLKDAALRPSPTKSHGINCVVPHDAFPSGVEERHCARAGRRRQRSRSKHRRISLSLKQCSLMRLGTASASPTSSSSSSSSSTTTTGGDTPPVDVDMMSPGVKPKPPTRRSIGSASRRLTRRGSAGGSWQMTSEDNDVSALDAWSSMRFLSRDDLAGLTEATFKGVIIGGTYQQCFEDVPLVAPPGSSQAHVVAVRLIDGGRDIELTVHRVRTRATQVVRLGNNWRWLRAEPDGFLLTAQPPVANVRSVLYWLPRHPLDWAVDQEQQERLSLSTSAVGFMGLSSPAPTEASYEPSPSPSSRVVWTPGRQGLTGHQVMHPDNDGVKGLMKGLVDKGASPVPLPLGDEFSDTGAPMGATEDVELMGATADVDWNDTSILALVLEFLLGAEPGTTTGGTQRRRRRGRRYMQSTLDETASYRLVSKAWAIASYKLLAKHLTTLEEETSNTVTYPKWSRFMREYPRGRFLSSGACKEVFCVLDVTGAAQAVSVMDVADLRKRDMDAAVGRELEISMLCSALYTLNLCPNLVCIHSVFRSEHGVADTLWRRQERPSHFLTEGSSSILPPSVPPRRNLPTGAFQFIRMEYCRGGDLEEVVRRERFLDVDLIRALMFQMCFSLYVCREKLQMRHHDIKLLNFFATDAAALLSGRALPPGAGSLLDGEEAVRCTSSMRVGFGDSVFTVPLVSGDHSVVKLADFGTSVIGAGSLGDPVLLQHFTTLENTPPEFLLLGSRARQAYSSDTFPLGLSVLHLLTGMEPYEELLSEVKCPPQLCQALAQLWLHGTPDDEYHLIRQVVDTLELDTDYDTGETSTGGAVGAVLYDSLYRYLVLFEASGADAPDPSSAVGQSAAWAICCDVLELGVQPVEANMSLDDSDCEWSHGDIDFNATADHHEGPAAQLRSDRSIWSLRYGSHPVVKSARERLGAVGGHGMRLLRRMVHFDPSRRCSMHEALTSDIFTKLREGDRRGSHAAATAASFSSSSGAMTVGNEASPAPVVRLADTHFSEAEEDFVGLSFLHYYRSLQDGGAMALPLV